MTLGMKDKSGRVLLPGDFVVYGHALGRCAALQYGVILETYQPLDAYGQGLRVDRDGKPVVFAKVQGFSTDRNWDKESVRKMKVGTLQFGDRILIIRADQVAPEVLPLMKEVRVTSKGAVCKCGHDPCWPESHAGWAPNE